MRKIIRSCLFILIIASLVFQQGIIQNSNKLFLEITDNIRTDIKKTNQNADNIKLEMSKMNQDWEQKIIEVDKKIKKDIKNLDYQYLKKCSVIVKVGNRKEKPNFLGSGVIVKQDENHLYILTVKHVLKRGKYCIVKVINSKKDLITIKVENDNKYLSDKQDLALLKVDKPKNMKFTTSKITNKYPNIADKVYIVGHPLGLKYTFSEGRVSNFIEKENASWLMISAQTIFGNSGSPVFNENYEVIGIVVGGNKIYDKTTKQHLYLYYMTRAVKTEYLQELFDEVVEE